MPQEPPLSQGFGYGIVLGLGFAFAFGMILTTWVLKRYQNEVQTSESMAILAFSTRPLQAKSRLERCIYLLTFALETFSVQHRWKNREIGSGCLCCSLELDLGSDAITIIWSRLSIWCLWTVLVCLWRDGPDPAIRYLGH